MIGTRSERLVYWFALLDRSRLARGQLRLDGDAKPTTIKPTELEALACLAAANAVEQGGSAGAYLHLLPQLVRARLQGGLARVLGLDDAANFIENYWPTQLFVRHADPGRLGELAGLTLRALRTTPCSYTKAFVRDLAGRSHGFKPASRDIPRLYRAGYTLYFHDMRTSLVRAWCHSIGDELGLVPGLTRISAFASLTGYGIPTHYDRNDNFVLQLRGTKRWRLAVNRHVENPTAVYVVGQSKRAIHDIEAPRGLPDAMPADHVTVELSPGSVMFVPRGTWHDCETTTEESLHVNIQSGVATWKDLARYAVRRHLVFADPELRSGVQRPFMGGKLHADIRAQLARNIRRMADALDADDLALDEAAFVDFIRRERGNA